VTYIAAARCHPNSIQLSNTNPKKGDSLKIDWDASECKAAVVSLKEGNASVGGPVQLQPTITGPYVFQRSTAQYNSSFTGSQNKSQIQVDTTYTLYALDAMWRRDPSKSVTATVQEQSGTTRSTPCANNAPLHNFDFCVECPTGEEGQPPYGYSYSGYLACTEADGKVELQRNFGCTVKTGSCPRIFNRFLRHAGPPVGATVLMLPGCTLKVNAQEMSLSQFNSMGFRRRHA
jgi:hypothetical protein